MVQALDIQQGTDKWLEKRKEFVTGSNAGRLLKFGASDALEANQSAFSGNFWTERGQILEAQALEIYEHIYDVSVSRDLFMVNDKYPNAACSPDGLTDVLIEVKCFNERKHQSIEDEEGIPYETIAQIQFNLMICEMDIAHLVLYNPDVTELSDSFKVIEVKANKVIHSNIQKQLTI